MILQKCWICFISLAEKPFLCEAPRGCALLWSQALCRRGTVGTYYGKRVKDIYLQVFVSLTPSCGWLQVVYDVRGMLEKNRDTFRDDILNLLRESRWEAALPGLVRCYVSFLWFILSFTLCVFCFPLFVRSDFVYDLFEHVLSRNKQDTLKSSSKHRRPTVSSQFKASP